MGPIAVARLLRRRRLLRPRDRRAVRGATGVRLSVSGSQSALFVQLGRAESAMARARHGEGQDRPAEMAAVHSERRMAWISVAHRLSGRSAVGVDAVRGKTA